MKPERAIPDQIAPSPRQDRKFPNGGLLKLVFVFTTTIGGNLLDVILDAHPERARVVLRISFNACYQSEHIRDREVCKQVTSL
jgi:hypothetical protein